jgi:hypothetical protein
LCAAPRNYAVRPLRAAHDYANSPANEVLSQFGVTFSRRSIVRVNRCAAYIFLDASLLYRITGCDYPAVAFAEPVSSSPTREAALNPGEATAQYKSHAQMGQTTGRIDG